MTTTAPSDLQAAWRDGAAALLARGADFDVWRPELTQAEQSVVGGVMQAVDVYGAGPPPED